MKTHPFQLLEVVAIKENLPELCLRKGQVGTIVEELNDGRVFEVEFVESDGRNSILATLGQESLNPVYSCFDVADFFINLANVTGEFLSNLRLQKLLYFAQKLSLQKRGTPLFTEDFQAWVYGPVIPEIYHLYKDFGAQPIQKNVERNFPNDLATFLESVADSYFEYSAYHLAQMTHEEESWRRARSGTPEDQPSGAIIHKEWLTDPTVSQVAR